MASINRLRSALDRVEARRIELEQQIISELEARFFSEPQPDIDVWVIHMGSGKTEPMDGDATTTVCDSQFATTWFAV